MSGMENIRLAYLEDNCPHCICLFAAGKAEALTTPRSNAILYKLSILVILGWFQEESEAKQFTGNTNHWTRDKD